jgi:putative MATE family efflux protein
MLRPVDTEIQTSFTGAEPGISCPAGVVSALADAAHAAGAEVAASSAHDTRQVEAANLRRGRLSYEVLKLAGPAIAEQLLITGSQMAALIVIGPLGADSIAAVGVSNQINWFFQSGYFAFGTGTTTLVARLTGAGEPHLAESVVKQAVSVAIVLSLFVSGTGIVLAPAILSLMGATPEVLAPATAYLRLSFVSAIFASVNMCFSAALRGAGDTRTPLKVQAACSAVTVAIISVLVYGRFGLPALGVAGAGIALILAAAVTTLAYLVIFISGRFVVRLAPPLTFGLDMKMVRRLLSVGVPSALEQLLMTGGMTVFAGLVMSLGTVAYASHQIAMNITSLSFMTSFGFAVASTALVGRSLGAGEPQLAEAYALATSRIGVGTITVLSAMFFFFGRNLMTVYTDDLEIIAIGAMILRFAAFAQPPMSNYAILAGALRGAGDTRYPLYITFAGVWTMRLGVASILVRFYDMGLPGIWIAINFDQIVRTILVWLRFRTGRWKGIAI